MHVSPLIVSSLLHLAAEISSHPEIVELLLGKGANVNSLDRKQMTPLFMACMHDNFHGAKTLLEKGTVKFLKFSHKKSNLNLHVKFPTHAHAGADFACCDIHGKTAFDYIKDYEEWMECGYFTQDTRARLKGLYSHACSYIICTHLNSLCFIQSLIAYSLKHSRLLIRSLTQKLSLQGNVN